MNVRFKILAAAFLALVGLGHATNADATVIQVPAMGDVVEYPMLADWLADTGSATLSTGIYVSARGIVFDGTFLNISGSGHVNEYSTLADYVANTNPRRLSSGLYADLAGVTYNGSTYLVILEDGTLDEYSTRADFVNATNATTLASGIFTGVQSLSYDWATGRYYLINGLGTIQEAADLADLAAGTLTDVAPAVYPSVRGTEFLLVPEPHSALLILLGCATLRGTSRRRRR